MDLLALLVILGTCSSLAFGNDVKPSPPEDLDGSGDDEDFSGSGMESFLEELDTKGDEVSWTSVAPLVPTVTQMSTPQKPDIAVEQEETREENVTQHTHTTKPHDPIKEIFDFEKEPAAEEGTTLKPTTDQTSTVESGIDVKHQHHDHHTTLPVTSHPAKFEVTEETITSPAEVQKPFVAHEEATTPEVQKPFVAHEESTTSTPDEVDLVQDVTSTPEGSVQHVDHPETTSGLTSTPYAENEEITVGSADVDDISFFVETTTVKEDTHIHKHHHHPHHTTTSSTEIPLNGSDILIETTEKSDFLEPEKDLDHEDAITTLPTTPPGEDEHHQEHGHKHHKHHHHTTTPEATQSTVPEKFIVHTHEPKGRRINVPAVETTTAVPVLSEDDEPVGSTAQYNRSVVLTQDEDNLDSAEAESGDGPINNDIFFEEAATVPQNRVEPMPGGGDGSTDASHGIMERKELLAGIIAGGLAGLVFAASLVAFVFYRMKKKDEGSYSLEEPKQSNGGYQKPREQREFYA